MTPITSGCKWTVGAAVSIWLAVAGGAQAHVFIQDDPYQPGEELVVEFKGCRGSEAQLERLLPLVKQRQTIATSTTSATPAAPPPSVKVAVASPVRIARLSLPLVLGVGY